jgi:hypothetical protein
MPLPRQLELPAFFRYGYPLYCCSAFSLLWMFHLRESDVHHAFEENGEQAIVFRTRAFEKY